MTCLSIFMNPINRQHKRSARESLDCAMMLQELVNIGVSNLITFDAHDARVQNAIPLHGFDNVQPTYQARHGLSTRTRSDGCVSKRSLSISIWKSETV